MEGQLKEGGKERLVGVLEKLAGLGELPEEVITKFNI